MFIAKVIGITDADTYKVLYNNKTITIRLAHIDAPETKRSQPYGKEAKKVASNLCFGKMVKIVPNSYDRNKRLIADVYLQDHSYINLILVQKGCAWHFKKYSSNLKFSEAENIARKQKIGLWGIGTPIAPWLFRKIKAVNKKAIIS